VSTHPDQVPTHPLFISGQNHLKSVHEQAIRAWSRETETWRIALTSAGKAVTLGNAISEAP
jgi:hypothetical protein